MKPNGPWFRTPEAALYVGLSASTLEKFRLTGEGPIYYKAGRKIILYRREDLDEWLNQRRCRSTSGPRSQEAA
jgi:predicted DNA-binding transcriptional regulator AlpA